MYLKQFYLLLALMPEIIGIVLDNGLQSQNQDYLPSRLTIQREVILNIIQKVFDEQNGNLLGIFPTCQEIKNRIITPTTDKQFLMDFTFEVDLNKNLDYSLALFQAEQALQLSELSSKKLLVFMSSPVTEFGKVLEELGNIAVKGITVKLVFMGDALEFGLLATSELDFPNVSTLVLQPGSFVEDQLSEFLADGEEIEDFELQEALQKSMYEK